MCRGCWIPTTPTESSTTCPPPPGRPASLSGVTSPPETSAPVRRVGWRLPTGVLLAVAGLAALTAVLVPLRSGLALASVVLLYLVVVVATAAIGGLGPSLAAAVASDLLVNFYFVPPYHTLTVENRDHVITLVVYVAVAI